MTDLIVPVTIHTALGTVELVGEQQTTPGLAITPGLSFYDDGSVTGWRLNGAWALTHTSSGWRLPRLDEDDNIVTLRRAAAKLGQIGIDWTADKDSIMRQVEEGDFLFRFADAITSARQETS